MVTGQPCPMERAVTTVYQPVAARIATNTSFYGVLMARVFGFMQVGRHFLTGDNTTNGNDYDRIKCVKNVVNSGWSFNTGLNDIALCFLEGSSRFTPIKLADGRVSIIKDSVPLNSAMDHQSAVMAY